MNLLPCKATLFLRSSGLFSISLESQYRFPEINIYHKAFLLKNDHAHYNTDSEILCSGYLGNGLPFHDLT